MSNPDYENITSFFLDGARGVHIPRDFAECLKQSVIDRLDDEMKSALEYLKGGPDLEHYWDVWNDVLINIEIEDDNGDVWTLHQNDDLFLVNKKALEELTDEQQEGFWQHLNG